MESTNKMQTAQTASPVSLFRSPMCDGRADPYAKRLRDATLFRHLKMASFSALTI